VSLNLNFTFPGPFHLYLNFFINNGAGYAMPYRSGSPPTHWWPVSSKDI